MSIKKILIKLCLSLTTVIMTLQANATNSTDLVLSGNATSDCIGKNEVTFTITVTNNGDNDADNFTVKAPLPAGYTYLNSSSAVGTYSSSNHRWDLTNLAAGTSTTLSVTAKGNLSNAALIANLISTTTPDTNSKNNKITIIGNLDSDNDGVFDTCDKDDDNDGITDCQENGLNDNLADLFVTSGDAKINTTASTQEVILVPDDLWKQGQVWATRKIDFTKDFTIAMQAYLGTKDLSGADGIAVVLHNDPDTTSTQGTKGLGMGYSGIKNGLALELDTWYNQTTNDITEDHGTIKQTNDGAVLSNPIALPNLENGKWHDVIVTWDVSAARLHYTVNGLTAGTYINKNIIDDVFGGSSTVYFGYTAATGSRANEHKVRFPNTCETLINFFANDTDGDGLPNHLDLDSDNDGCADALEGSGKFTLQNLSTASTLLTNGIGSFAKSRQNLGVIVTTSGVNIGIPIEAKSGQTIGKSQKAGQMLITKQPRNQSVSIGSTATLSVENIAHQTTTYDNTTKKPDYSTSTAATSITYQWYKSTDNGNTWAEVTSGTTKNLSFNKVTYADAGQYKRSMSCDQNACKVETNIVKLAVNRPPVAVNYKTSTPEDTILMVNSDNGLLSNDTDKDRLSVTQFTVSGSTVKVDPVNGGVMTLVNVGTITINTDGSYIFNPTSNFNGSVPPITYTIDDNSGSINAKANALLNITVHAVNDAPVANPVTKTVKENTQAIGSLISNDTDLDNNPLTVTSITIPKVNNGQPIAVPVSIAVPQLLFQRTLRLEALSGILEVQRNGNYIFTPKPNYTGKIPVIGYTITDGNGGIAKSTLTLTMVSVNDNPTADNDIAFVIEGTPVSVPLNGRDTDGTIQNYIITQIPPSNQGTITYTDVNNLQQTVIIGTQLTPAEAVTVRFTLSTNYKGAITPIIFTVIDNKGATSQPAIVNLTVAPQSVPILSLWSNLLMMLLMIYAVANRLVIK